MKLWMILPVILILAVLIVLVIAYVCFRIAFYIPARKEQDSDVIDTPEGAIYDPFREKMAYWVKEARKLPQESIEITSFDGLRLHGVYYEYEPGAPIELMFHGYRGNAERDLSGGVQRCFKLGRSALIVDQRCSGKSDGNVTTFGINERRDCLAWLDYMQQRFDPDAKIILTGISMGAATVLMAAGEELPKNVIGVLADCGYSSPKAIIKKVIRQMRLPVELSYPFVKLAARVFGQFDLEEASPLEAMSRCKVPVIFFHGEADDLVPCEMSREMYEACVSKKRLVTVPGAGHGLSYPVEPARYLSELRDFFG